MVLMADSTGFIYTTTFTDGCFYPKELLAMPFYGVEGDQGFDPQKPLFVFQEGKTAIRVSNVIVDASFDVKEGIAANRKEFKLDDETTHLTLLDKSLVN